MINNLSYLLDFIHNVLFHQQNNPLHTQNILAILMSISYNFSKVIILYINFKINNNFIHIQYISIIPYNHHQFTHNFNNFQFFPKKNIKFKFMFQENNFFNIQYIILINLIF